MTLRAFNQPPFTADTAYDPFALTDVFTQYVTDQQEEILHFWQFKQTVILGMKDSRVPHLSPAVNELIAKNYHPLLRNSGGLGIVADEGILNLSYIFPNHDRQLSTQEAYEKMLHIVRKAFPELTIEAYEMVDSYCPGTYDLNVGGQKIAGSAQRRLKEGVAVMIYLSVNGDQQARGSLIREFYQTGLQEAFGTNGYPAVNPQSMTTLAAALGYEISVAEVEERFLAAFAQPPVENPYSWIQATQQTDLFEQKRARMRERNEVIKDVTQE